VSFDVSTRGGRDRPAADRCAVTTSDRFELERFVGAQDAGDTYMRALGELRSGHKTSHWMWFVFPQLRALGRSPTAHRYGIDGLDEARAYLEHAVLGPRLLAVVEAVGSTADRSTDEILGPIDAMKLRSSMTLFARAAADPTPFVAVLERFYDGAFDEQTDALLARQAEAP
jgi:uncharacterized protein (DUF1810 family)